MRSASDLPNDIDELKRLVIASNERLAVRTAELAAAKTGLIAITLEAEKLKFELARLKRMQFGQSSERLDRQVAQLELKLEDIETAAAEGDAPSPLQEPEPTPDSEREEATPKKPRRKLPDHLPRRDETHEPASCACPRCGTERMRKVGEDVTEILEYLPGRFEVVRHVRPAYSCAKCEAMAQAPMPALPIPRGLAGASVIAHVVMSKYADHLPLYRQAEIYARNGLDLDRSLLAEWVGKAAWLLRPLAERIGEHVMTSPVIHADDTPVPVLAPGHGKTRTGRLWIYLRHERPHAGPAPPAVLYRYTPDRKGERCRAHLSSFRGHLHADGYAGFAELYERDVTEVACWAHVRRKFFDVHKANASPIAREALERIGALFEIERGIAGISPDERCRVRQTQAGSKLDDMAAWLDAQLKQIPGKSELAGAIRYARSRWDALTAYVDDGRLEISNNAAENAVRPIALGRKNWLFAGSDSGWGIPDKDWGDGPNDAAKATLIDVIEATGARRLAYLYDFGDGWEHTIAIEKIVAPEPGAAYPRLLEASGRCPPEDVGGPPGYEEFLTAIRDPADERHAEFTQWYDADFDPGVVDVDAIKQGLAALAKRWSRPARKRKTS